jgi:DNA primase
VPTNPDRKSDSFPSVDRDQIEYIKQLIDPSRVISALGIDTIKTSGTHARGACPIHGGDNTTAFCVDLITGLWICFSRQCHEGNSDIIGLVKLIRKCSFMEALEFIGDACGIDVYTRDEAAIRRVIYRKDMIEFTRRIEKNDTALDLCPIQNIEDINNEMISNRISYFYDMGYTTEVHDYFGIGSYVDKNGITRASIPIRDSSGKLVAIDGRRIDSDGEPRYFIQPDGFTKGNVLYHYHNAKRYVKSYDGDLFIVEGYKACWSMIMTGYYNTIACMGAGLTHEQPNLLYDNEYIKRIILILDGDAAGKNGSRRSKKHLQLIYPVTIIDLPKGTDPSNLDRTELHTIINKSL